MIVNLVQVCHRVTCHVHGPPELEQLIETCGSAGERRTFLPWPWEGLSAPVITKLTEQREDALDVVKTFDTAYETKLGNAVAKITGDIDVLLASYDYPVEHRIHLCTPNSIESTFAVCGMARR